MKTILMIAAIALSSAATVYAETEPTEPTVAERRAAFEAMTPEERRAAIAERRAGRGELSDAQRAERRERFRNLSDEQRAAIRQSRQQRRAGQAGRPGADA